MAFVMASDILWVPPDKSGVKRSKCMSQCLCTYALNDAQHSENNILVVSVVQFIINSCVYRMIYINLHKLDQQYDLLLRKVMNRRA